MMHLRSLVKRNIELAQVRQNEVLNSDVASFRYWEGYINALESIVHVLPHDKDEHEEILQARQSPTSSDNPTSS
jgi:hypothetical protein